MDSSALLDWSMKYTVRGLGDGSWELGAKRVEHIFKTVREICVLHKWKIISEFSNADTLLRNSIDLRIHAQRLIS